MSQKNARILCAVCLWVGVISGGLSCPIPALARVLLKPNGQNAMPLRTKTLSADVTITGQFATTKTVMTFQNETSNRIEADFIYTAPQDAVITYFAYWYGNEKVVARVVEKERAAQIYQYITSRMRDPALIEMIGKNTFRTRIFPIMPNADLKIEMHMVQVLSADKQGAVYEFPLQPEEPGKGTLEKLDLNVHIAADTSLQRVLNNYNLPVQQAANGAYRLRVEQSNYRPPMDLRIRLVRRPEALHTALYAARSGGRDGFFALALTPARSLKKPSWKIAGVQTYDVVPARLPDAATGGVLTVFGRYRGSGMAVVTLTGWTPQGRWNATKNVTFTTQQRSNNLATKLWASQRIEHLSLSEKNRERVVALSQRFTLPSKFTSWLAIPQEERERYHQEKAQADISFYAQLLAREIAAGRTNTRAARRLREQLKRACDVVGYRVEDALSENLRTRMDQVANAWVAEKYKTRPNQRRMTTLRRELVRLAAATGTSAQKRLQQTERYRLSPIMTGVANALVQEKHKARPDRRRIANLNNQLNRMARASGTSSQQHLKVAEAGRLRVELGQVTQQLGEEIIAGRDQGARAQQLQRRYDEIMRNNPDLQRDMWYAWEITRRPREAYSAKAHDVAYQIIQEKKSAKPDPQKLAALQAELERLSRKVGRTPEQVLDYENSRLAWNTDPINMREYFMRQGDPLISIQAPEDAEQIIALMPGGEVKKLVLNPDSKKWEARFDIPTYAAEGEYSIIVVIVRKDGTRQTLTLRYHVDITAPQGTGQAQVVSADTPNLRLEVDGDKDTARVLALLPWGEKVALKPSTVQEQRFFALVPVPGTHRGQESTVTYILTDKAHNRTTVTVDVSK